MQSKLDRLLAAHQTRLRVLLLCLLSAFLYNLASPDLHWHPICWVLLVPLLQALDGRDLRQGFLIGWCCGSLVHLICFAWVIGTIQRYSNLNLTLSIVAWVLFSLYSGLAFGAMASLAGFLRSQHRLPPVIVYPVCYTAMEFLFPFIFPWHLGAGLYEVLPVIQICDLFGVYGVTALVVVVNAALWEVLHALGRGRPFPRASAAAALALVGLTLVYGVWRVRAIDAQRGLAERYAVGIVQPNIRIEEKQSPLLQSDIWRRYQRLSTGVVNRGAQLVVWPESAVHFAYDPEARPQSFSGVLRRLVQSLGRPLLFGTWSMGRDAPRNTAHLLSPEGGVAGRYDKMRLLAFGEYLPLSHWFPVLQKWIQGVGDFEPGDRIEPLCWQGVCFGVLICYEAILDGPSREFASLGTRFLVNITNDAWFGQTRCPEQHLMLASFRAVENRLWLVRVANTGISAFVDPVGRILQRTPLFEVADRIQTIELLDIPSLYKAWGDWFPWGCALCALILLVLGLFRKRGQSGAKPAAQETGRF